MLDEIKRLDDKIALIATELKDLEHTEQQKLAKTTALTRLIKQQNQLLKQQLINIIRNGNSNNSPT